MSATRLKIRLGVSGVGLDIRVVPRVAIGRRARA
jgi:hypothetical protein